MQTHCGGAASGVPDQGNFIVNYWLSPTYFVFTAYVVISFTWEALSSTGSGDLEEGGGIKMVILITSMNRKEKECSCI